MSDVPAPILSARSTVKAYGGGWWRARGSVKRAVDDVSLDVHQGETLAIVGESGSGKSSLARMLLGLSAPSAGDILFEGRSLKNLDRRGQARFRKAVQPVFQDPASSLNPRMSVGTTLTHVLRRHRPGSAAELQAGVAALLQSVGLDPGQFAERFPHQMSGGQQQRVAIARALAVEPRVIVADEPLSSLDMSVQAQVLDLLVGLKASRRLGLVLISHDLNVVDAIADRVAVMYLGAVVEAGPARQVLRNPASDYTRTLLAAKLIADPRLARERRRALEARPPASPTPPEPARKGCDP